MPVTPSIQSGNPDHAAPLNESGKLASWCGLVVWAGVPDLLLVELKTIQRRLRFVIPRSTALKAATHIEKKAKLLTPE